MSETGLSEDVLWRDIRARHPRFRQALAADAQDDRPLPGRAV